MTTPTNNIHKRGFASMDKDRLREVSRKAGASVPAAKRAFSMDPDLARRAALMQGKYATQEDEDKRHKSYQEAVLAALACGKKSYDVVRVDENGSAYWTIGLQKDA